MCLNLNTEQILFRVPPLASDENRPHYSPGMAAKVVVSKNNIGGLGKPMQAADPAAWLSSNRTSIHYWCI